MKTRFDKTALPERSNVGAPDYRRFVKSSFRDRLAAKTIDRMHKH